jgi:hypothetical protein
MVGLTQEGFPNEDKPIEFIVVTSIDSRPIENAEVIVLSRDQGLFPIGKTDSSGRVFVDRASLVDTDAVLFCKEGFFCGALRIVDDHVLELESRLVVLAFFAIS